LLFHHGALVLDLVITPVAPKRVPRAAAKPQPP